jgi:lipopolysaccharide transport system ATP-binding protein
MSDYIISAKDVTKTYRLYSKPHFRFLDVIGLLKGDGKYSEHHALNGVSLNIKRGEKVALIGRNGAGKSTLLKLITGVIQATSGVLTVKAKASALLQIGTTFHPEFTGRENVVSYLAHLGISGAEAEEKLVEIIEFSELEEYIDQPVKTYSTGMGARLMFSASTAIQPDLLVIDEILSVGDAYFAHKSYSRIKDMCEKKQTTLLLVTHDIYSASNLCERMIWIDRGQITIDNNCAVVMKAYEDSIRVQEENRLRLKKQTQMAVTQSKLATAQHGFRVLIEIFALSNCPQPVPVHIREISLYLGTKQLGVMPMDDDFSEEKPFHLVREPGCWSEEHTLLEGKPVRTMLNYGSSFHKVTGAFTIESSIANEDLSDLSFAIEYMSSEACQLGVRAYYNETNVSLGQLPPSSGNWVRHTAARHQNHEIESADNNQKQALNFSGVFGTGRIVVTNVSFVDQVGAETFILEHKKPLVLQIKYQIPDITLFEKAQLVVAMHRDGGFDVCRYITRELVFNAKLQSSGTVEFQLSSLPLSNGKYSITIMIAKEGYYDESQPIYFSLNPGVYCCLSKVIEVEVVGGDLVSQGTVFVGDGHWELKH